MTAWKAHTTKVIHKEGAPCKGKHSLRRQMGGLLGENSNTDLKPQKKGIFTM